MGLESKKQTLGHTCEGMSRSVNQSRKMHPEGWTAPPRGLGSCTERNGEIKLSTSLPLSLFPDRGSNMTSCPMPLIQCLRLHLQNVSQLAVMIMKTITLPSEPASFTAVGSFPITGHAQAWKSLNVFKPVAFATQILPLECTI